MATAPVRLRVRLTPELSAKLSEMAAQRGVSAQVLAEAFVASGATGINAVPSKDRPIGRPVQNDLPPEVERSPITSGFTGIYPRGSRWLARWLHEELGMFSNPELAAIARYWFEQGRRSVARDSLIATGTPRAEAVRLARFKGGGEPLDVPAAPVEGVGDAAAVGAEPVAPRRRGRPRKERNVAVEDRQDHVERMAVDLDACGQAPCPRCTEVLTDGGRVCGRCDGTVSANGGGSPDTTYDEPPEDLGSRPGGKAPASPESLRWARKFGQLRMVDYDPPPPKPLDPGSDPDER